MRIPIAPEGRAFVAIPLALALGTAALHLAAGVPWLLVALGFAGAALFSAFFFRDPTRRPPEDPDAVVAAADGVVTAVAEDEDGATRITVFLSIFDVHVNRAPVSGVVTGVERRSGEFRAAFREDAGERNETNEVRIRSGAGTVRVRQIVGAVARRIVCRVAPGDRLARGERFGLIRFGSRTDVLLPAGCQVLVRPRERVRGGETLVARLP